MLAPVTWEALQNYIDALIRYAKYDKANFQQMRFVETDGINDTDQARQALKRIKAGMVAIDREFVRQGVR